MARLTKRSTGDGTSGSMRARRGEPISSSLPVTSKDQPTKAYFNKKKHLLVHAVQVFGVAMCIYFLHAAVTNTKSDDVDKDNDIVNLQLGLEPSANVFQSCSEDDLVIMDNQLGNPSASTRCPENSWIEDFYDQEGLNLGSEDGSFLGLSIGCNKGFDSINTARMGMRNMAFDKQEWYKLLVVHGIDQKEGACGQEKSPQYNLNKMGIGSRKGEMHCVEPMPSTFGVVKNVADEMKLHMEGFVTTLAAISSRDGTISFPTGADIKGEEAFSIASCNSKKVHCEDIRMYSLQTYVEKYVKSKGPINILSVDVEGFDFDVLFGAGSVLDRTQYLEFEYHKVGAWGKLHVHDLVNLLDGKGFNCYWAGKKKLWRITNCELKKFEKWHGWSNVACVHRSQNELAQNMENLFLVTIGKTLP